VLLSAVTLTVVTLRWLTRSIGVNAIMGGKKRKTPDADGEAAPKAPKQPKVTPIAGNVPG
jgi:hypothetical protein